MCAASDHRAAAGRGNGAGVSPEAAIATVRRALGLDAAVTARACLTRRLDRPGRAYYLVLFGDDRATVAVGAVEAASGEIETSARLAGERPHLSVDADRAIRLAGLGDRVEAALVWKPCRASRSPLDPIWEVRAAGGTRYVDQQGQVWPE